MQLTFLRLPLRNRPRFPGVSLRENYAFAGWCQLSQSRWTGNLLAAGLVGYEPAVPACR